jgi:hypothetical protein
VNTAREAWLLDRRATITAEEMKFLRKPAKYTLYNYKRKQCIIKELKTEPVLEKNHNYKIKLTHYFRRMDRFRLPNDIMKYQPEGKRNPGRLIIKILDCYIDTGAGQKA